MTGVYIGFNAYRTHNHEIKAIPALVGAVPEEIQEDDLIYRIDHEGQKHEFCAGKTAVDVADRTSPIEGDDNWIQLLSAVLADIEDDINELAVALSILNWDDHEQLKSRLSNPWTVDPYQSEPFILAPKRLEIYPAITAALYDLHLKLAGGQLQAQREELLEDRTVLLLLVSSRHTEWILAKGLKPIKGGVLYSGISTVQLEVRDFFYSRTGSSLLPADAEAALHTSDVEIDEKFVSVENYINVGRKKLAEALNRDIEKLQWQESPDNIFLAGEGLAYVEASALEKWQNDGIEIVQNPDMAVLRGLELLLKLTEPSDE
ncbi:hypothetical protein ACFSR7_05735 [Cohnella sp. GCM10020058]|uniref:hypothetical protein n=1 Tax=Cohnella sp. GCM10020058 TaxID=3317330 RepID=UPI0036370FE0